MYICEGLDVDLFMKNIETLSQRTKTYILSSTEQMCYNKRMFRILSFNSITNFEVI